MSIVNAFATRDELIVEVDTLAGSVGPGLVDTSTRPRAPKLAVIPHQQLVAAMRGSMLFFTVATGAMQTAAINTPDELMDHLPDLLSASHRQFATIAEERAPELLQVENDGVAGIYSERLGRIRAVTFSLTKDGELSIDDLSSDGAPDVHLSPWFNELVHWEKYALAAQTIDPIPAMQLRLMQVHCPDLMTGGELVAVRVARDAMTVTRRPEPKWQ